MPKRAVVTGGAGFIGSHLVERLLAEGWEVAVLDDLSNGTTDNLPKPDSKRLRIVDGDVRDPRALAGVCKGAEAIFHLAAVSSLQAAKDHPDMVMDVNVEGTKTALEEAGRAGTRSFIFASSAAVYGRLEPPLKESQGPSPISVYGASKALAEEACLKGQSKRGFRVTVLRFFNVYGEGSVEGQYAGVISKFASALLKGEKPVIFGTGKQTRDFVYIDDVLNALGAAATSKVGSGRVYNVGTGRPTTINELLKTETRLLGLRGPHKALQMPAREGDIENSFADISSISRDLGYSPAVTLEEGLSRYLKWFVHRE